MTTNHGPNTNQAARDAFEDLGLIDDDRTEDLYAWSSGRALQHDRKGRSRPGRAGGPRRHHLGTNSGHATSSKRRAALSDVDVRFEWIGEYYDDVLVYFEYDMGVGVAAIRKLPPWAAHWNATSKVWRINPGYTDWLVATLRDLGYTVIELITNSAPVTYFL